MYVGSTGQKLKYGKQPYRSFTGDGLGLLDSLSPLQEELVREGKRDFVFSNGVHLYLDSAAPCSLLVEYLDRVAHATVHVDSLSFSAGTAQGRSRGGWDAISLRPLVLIIFRDSITATSYGDTIFNGLQADMHAMAVTVRPPEPMDVPGRLHHSEKKSRLGFLPTRSLAFAERSAVVSRIAEALSAYRTVPPCEYQLQYTDSIGGYQVPPIR